MGARSYKVTSPIHFGGKVCGIDETVELTTAQATQFASCIELDNENKGTNQNNAQLSALQDQLAQTNKLLSETEAELLKYQQAMATLIEEHDAALLERDTQTAELNTQISELNAQIAELKKEPASKKK